MGNFVHNPGAGDGMTARIPYHRLLLPIGLVARKAGRDFQNVARLKADAFQPAQAGIIGRWHAMHKRQIAAVDAVRLELRGQPVMRPVGFRHDQKAGRVLVNAVHDARSPLATNA